jgi:crossover junction endodeoxyribonuclease RusA
MFFITDIPPSVNHAYANNRKGQRILTATAKVWVSTAGCIARAEARKQGWKCSQGVKLVMEIWVYWPDNKRRDTNNLFKLMCDAFEGVLYDDDRYVLPRAMDYSVDKKNPRVEYVVREWET